MTKGDLYFKEFVEDILENGSWDKNPRPRYKDGTPAHTISINHKMATYDLSKGESPLMTLRPIAVKSAFGELLWIYQDQSNDLDLLVEKYNVRWWDEWDIGDRTIGACYGHTVKRYNQMDRLLDGLKKDPDGRRHIINLWQLDEFEQPHGLKPCAFQTNWNVRHGKDGRDYLDMCLYQRSSDFATAGCINQVQYAAFLVAVATCLGYAPGKFSWMVDNIQIYDRHVEVVKEMLKRKHVDCSPAITVTNGKSWQELTQDDFQITGYPRELIKIQNPQVKFEIAV